MRIRLQELTRQASTPVVGRDRVVARLRRHGRSPLHPWGYFGAGDALIIQLVVGLCVQFVQRLGRVDPVRLRLLFSKGHSFLTEEFY